MTGEGPSRTILLAEMDRHTLNQLPCVLSERLPDITIDICPSAQQLPRMLSNASYDAVAVCPVLLHDYCVFQHKIDQYLLVPMIITAGRDDLSLAETALNTEAFDLITKPIIPQEAIQTVKLALWHNRLLRLLISKERAVVKFHEHMRQFPHALKMEQEFNDKMTAYERTLRAVSMSIQLLSNDEEQSAFDVAALVMNFTKQRALDRLFNLCSTGASQ